MGLAEEGRRKQVSSAREGEMMMRGLVIRMIETSTVGVEVSGMRMTVSDLLRKGAKTLTIKVTTTDKITQLPSLSDMFPFET